MPSRRPNPGLVKVHRSYCVDEIARLFGIHRNTVRAWFKAGLRTVDARRPALVLGRDLADFLRRRRASRRRECGPGEIYCLRCREPREPAGRCVAYEPVTATHGNLAGRCSCCGAKVLRRTSVAKLPVIAAVLDVMRMPGERHIGDSQTLSLNSDFAQDLQDHAYAPP